MKLLLKLLAAWLALVNGAIAADPARKPNFLFIFTDDQRYDAMSVVQAEQGAKGRFPWLKTPNLDRLAADGVRFRNAFVVNALCAPSRASLITGCYGHVNGVVNNHTPFPATNVTCASELRKAGYVSAYIGKWHMGNQSGQRPSFDYSASFIGQGKYVDCPVEVNGKSTPTKGWIDDVSTDYAVNFIRDHKDKPFLMFLGFKTCHGPFAPPERTAKAYENEQARAVPNLVAKAIYREGPLPPRQVKAAAEGAGPTNLGMFRAITAIDENVGRLLKLLDELGLAEDTVVVFSSDNGYYLGEHGLGDKRSAYEESMRVPMLLRYPRLAGKGKTLDPIVLNVDVTPTFLDLAGVPIPREMHGRSWRPLLEGKAADVDWRKAFFYCYYFERNFKIPTVTAVRTDTAKLIQYPGHDEWTELFDLQADPYETKNLIRDPAAKPLREQLEAEYQKQSTAIAFRIPEFADKPDPASTPENESGLN
jgi:arylsulfatase A-like enzyme